MQTYEDDDIFIFGFSRGAYVARFLATMLDHVGLLSAGNEEMARFAWKAFARWQQRQDETEEDAKKKLEMFSYLQAFRETFSRPVRRIRFLGLFDTGKANELKPISSLTSAPVNSVPQFENAWMQRSKFPYSVSSSAKVVRHAVSIDERRAKFRSDLVSGKGPGGENPVRRHHHYHHHHRRNGNENHDGGKMTQNARPAEPSSDRFRRPSHVRSPLPSGEPRSQPGKEDDENSRLKPRQRSPDGSQLRAHSFVSSIGSNHFQPAKPTGRLHEDDDDNDIDEAAKQDLEEIWFPGCHADIGGGWPISVGEELPLSHGPLVWMVREAERAGLNFDREMMVKLKCGEDFQRDWEDLDHSVSTKDPGNPIFQVTNSTNPDPLSGPHSEKQNPGWVRGLEPEASKESEFHKSLRLAGTGGHLHDCLKFKNGLSAMSVISWKMMEYLPFRRMDLKPDGSWAAISFP